MAEVSFEGEPLSGLQIMGVLESRVLDFETVIITSMNEGKFPAGKSNNSFIPLDVKREYDLPTYKEKDAIYTYHFYHLLQRAKNIFLIYNTESEGFDSGEKSRFITQLELENRPNHIFTHEIFNAAMPKVAATPRSILKSESVIDRLHEISKGGFSPSALTSYIRNPMAFYFERILRIRDFEEVEETIAANTLGTIIHETLRVFYKPYEGKLITENVLRGFLQLIDEEVRHQFKIIYKEGEINKGRNLLAFEVAKRHLHNFINKELQSIEQGDNIRILAIEKTFERWLNHPSLPCPILIKGNVDRIEERNGVVRIIDYKTGKVEKRNMLLKTWDGLTKELKNDKIIQVLAYSYMFTEEGKTNQIEAGIISFKNLSAGFLPFTVKSDNQESTIITEDVLQNFINEIVVLLQEIFDTKIPFEEKL
jgi:ATP-dependent helicase/DNAse subunit B